MREKDIICRVVPDADFETGYPGFSHIWPDLNPVTGYPVQPQLYVTDERNGSTLEKSAFQECHKL